MARHIWAMKFALAAIFLTLAACSPVKFTSTRPLPQNHTGEMIVSAAKPNPPLDLFFVVDNSGSMLGHQIDLGSAFAKVFSANSPVLANFNVRVFLFSTASTVNYAFAGSVPSGPPNTATTFLPRNIFGFWDQMTGGTFGQAPFRSQFLPAPVIDTDPLQHRITQHLDIQKKSGLTDSAYRQQLERVTQQFQHRLSYLNPSQQLQYEPLTDISSGLCTISRILRHPQSFTRSGDSAAFIIVSDDDDRLFVRNPKDNQCIDSIAAPTQVVDGSCGHYETEFSYVPAELMQIPDESRFRFESGTQVYYSTKDAESCVIEHAAGYKYRTTYTLTRTLVHYEQCRKKADGTCVGGSFSGQATLLGNFLARPRSHQCAPDVSKLVPLSAPETHYSCTLESFPHRAGPTGLDANSNGRVCSAELLRQISRAPGRSHLECKIVGAEMTSDSLVNQPIGTCVAFCKAHRNHCRITKHSLNLTQKSLSMDIAGVTCESPAVVEQLRRRVGRYARCDTTAPRNSTLVVSAQNLDCDSPLNGLKVHDAQGNVVCGRASSVADCISHRGDDKSTCVAVKTQIDFASLQSRAKRFRLKFKPDVAAQANCQSKCSDVIDGGACLGSTVKDYIQHKLGGGNCQSEVKKVSDTAPFSVSLNQSAQACLDQNKAIFIPRDQPRLGQMQLEYVAGDSQHFAADFENFIFQQSQNIFGANNMPVIAVITHLPEDHLPGTDVGKTYIQLAQMFHSDQVSSINGNYADALNNISQFIVQSTMNNFHIPIPDSAPLLSVYIRHKGDSQYQKLSANQWSRSGQTLSIRSDAGLRVGDLIEYKSYW